ncbi:hypothetical protein GSI_09719 [Ganoderma sinense ZZ0214-1]|uniref:RING-type domain-containing protein n=1 Tax=Ganoderma sinense ZZ0214-1 TaxID=1077348 RepID=A0A2G8S357_9APHY|nr:hypothetical protein GSI_09719 [Ganoderma sinense ZZ0214-1]
MPADAQAADALKSDALFNSSLLLNTTLKLAHRFLGLPSRALARLRRLDDMALELHVAAQTATTQQAGSGTPGYRRHRNAGHVGIAPMPGPWGFLTSGYFLGLFVMTHVITSRNAQHGTLTTGLEGLNINDSAPFNLFAFAFQLYVETASHPTKEGEESTRPNIHIVTTVFLPLLQLTIMHTLEIQRRWTHHRLAFSTTIGLFALLHFHYVVWCSPTPFPLTTYAARVVESAMLAIITLTVSLNALTQLLSEGTLARPLFAHAALLPKADEDFNVALFRLGTASMEATAVAGLGNEVGGVSQAHGSSRESREVLVRGELEIDRAGVAALRPAYEQHGARRVKRKGFRNEITDVKVRAASTDFWVNTVLNVAWHRDFGSFLASMWRAVRRVWTAAVEKARGSRGLESEREPSVEVVDGPEQRDEATEDPYDRFIRGEPVSDDEDDDFHPDDEGTPQPETDSGSSEDEDEEDHADEDEEAAEQARLYADLSQSDAGSAPLLLAHMTDKSASPLTRRGYRELVRRPTRVRNVDDADDWEEFVEERRTAKRMPLPGPDEDRHASQNTRSCVICTVEPRDIICWPCRCLALCDDCRNNLASRSSASKHTCPCCRRSVEGYSKIYIP